MVRAALRRLVVAYLYHEQWHPTTYRDPMAGRYPNPRPYGACPVGGLPVKHHYKETP